MEGKSEFVLKKTVAMFNQLTGKRLKPNEGQTFLDLYDMVAEHHGLYAVDEEVASEPTPWEIAKADRENPDAVETFAAASHALNLDPRYDAEPAETSEREPFDGMAKIVTSPTGILAQLAETETPGYVPRFIGREVEKAVTPDLKPQAPAKTYSPPTISSKSRAHILGYDWQIVVLDREKRDENSYIVHFAHAPTQEEFNEHYFLFYTRSHHVHLNQWIEAHWVGITEGYREGYSRPANPAVAPCPVPEGCVVHVAREVDAPKPVTGRDVSKPAMSDPWEQPEKPFRIRYYSDVAGATIYFYADKRPTGKEMSHFHHAKCLAVSQARPAEVAA